MKHRISKALNEIDARYIHEAETYRRKKHHPARWIAAAACLVLLLGAAFWFGNRPTGVEAMLAAVAQHGNVDTVLEFAFVPVGDRVAVYHCEGRSDKLAEYLGVNHAADWYRTNVSGNLKYLIRRDAEGSLSLWVFSNFVVESSDDETWLREQYPDADYSTYTYGEVYETIYGVTSAEQIQSITAAPSKSNNTDFGKEIQQQVGTHTYTDRADIETFYRATVDVVCYGESDWADYYETPNRFTYSFSTDAQDKLTSGEETWATRWLTIELIDDTTIDSWKYSALKGCFYEFGGIGTAPLDEAIVLALNAIFDIA